MSKPFENKSLEYGETRTKPLYRIKLSIGNTSADTNLSNNFTIHDISFRYWNTVCIKVPMAPARLTSRIFGPISNILCRPCLRHLQRPSFFPFRIKNFAGLLLKCIFISCAHVTVIASRRIVA